MRTFQIALVCLAACGIAPQTTEAQIHVGRFGGVSIDVPLVSVDVLPFGGGTRVRAPFTSVNTGIYGSFHPGGYHLAGPGSYSYGHGIDGPHVGIPVYPSHVHHPYTHSPHAYRVPIYSSPLQAFPYYGDVTLGYAMPPGQFVYPRPYDSLHNEVPSSQTLGHQSEVYGNYRAARPIQAFEGQNFPEVVIDEKTLLQSAKTLRDSLARRPDDADIWLDYLNPDLISEVVISGSDPSSLVDLLKNYDGLSGNASLSHLWTEPGFRRTHQGLRYLVANGAFQDPPTSAQPAVIPTPIPIPDASPNQSPLLDEATQLPELDKAEEKDASDTPPDEVDVIRDHLEGIPSPT